MALPVLPLAYPIRYMPDKPPRCSREALFTYPVVGLPQRTGAMLVAAKY